MIWKKISDKFLSNIWLIENVLWKFTSLVIIRQDKERKKKILYELYGYKDIYDFYPQQLDNRNLDSFMNRMMTYHEQPWETKKEE